MSELSEMFNGGRWLTLNQDDPIVKNSGGGSIEFEEGKKVFTAAATGNITINFANEHSSIPDIICVAQSVSEDATFASLPSGYIVYVLVNFAKILSVNAITLSDSNKFSILAERGIKLNTGYNDTVLKINDTTVDYYVTAESFTLFDPGTTTGPCELIWKAFWLS